jgi:hypothetical protein
MGYADVYAGWKADPESFWLDAAGGIDWVKAPVRALDDSRAPLYEWFTDTEVNTCWNAVDRHVAAGRGDQLAIIHDSPVTHEARHHLCRTADPRRLACRCPARPRRGKGRPRHHLHAHGPRGAGGDAGLRAAGRHPFRRLRRLRGPGTCRPHRRLQAQGDHRRLLRDRAEPGCPLQAPARRRDRPCRRTSPTSA